MEKVIPKSETKFLQNLEKLRKSFVKILFQILELLSPLYYSNNIYCLQYLQCGRE